MKSCCDESSSANPYAKCGTASCEVCYPEAALRTILQDLMDANDQLRVRGKAAQSLAEEVSDFKSDVQVMKDALIWLGSSSLSGETVGQVTNVRKKVVEALVSASAIDTLEISEESSEKQEANSEQHDNRNDNRNDNNDNRNDNNDNDSTD